MKSIEERKVSSTDLNIELDRWKDDLQKKFIFQIPEHIGILEKTKIVKTNIIDTLDIAYKIASFADDQDIFETSQSQENIKLEMEQIKKDVVSIAVFGQMSSGKSSFLNALAGDELLIVKQSRATAIITVIRHISNFEGYKDGDVLIQYKSSNDILLKIDRTLEELSDIAGVDYFNKFMGNSLYETIDLKDELIQKLDNFDLNEIATNYKKIVRGLKKSLKFILNGLAQNNSILGKNIKVDSFNKELLADEEKSIFISEVIFYTNIDLLKNIELIDTPGLGSNSLEDTRKSEDFLSKADIIMVLTDAKEPLQKDSETDIFDRLQEIAQKNKIFNFFDKVFIIINKIDDCENDRLAIQELLDESLEDIEMTHLKDTHKMFISAKYEYQKKFSPEGLKSLPIINPNNITNNDLEIIEKTIYTFSAAEATRKFLNEKIKKIEEIFSNADNNFENNIEKINQHIDITEKKIEKFESNKIKIEKELKQELTKIVKDNYRVILGTANTYKDDELGIVANYRYAQRKAEDEKTFKNANKDNTSDRHYEKIGKKFLKKIVFNTSKKLERDINNEVLSDDVREKVKQELKAKASEIQKKYENEYGVSLDIKDRKIGSIQINLSNNVDLQRGAFREFIDFFRLLTWGSEKKFIETTAREWEKYSQGKFKNNLETEIKNKINESEKKVQEKVNEEILNLIKTIEKQLRQELTDKENYQKDKEQTNANKLIIQEAFKYLQEKHIAKTKIQNQELFQQEEK